MTTSSVGTSYTTLIGGRRAAINLSVKNLAKKLYYSSAVNGALGISAPRNVSLSVRLAAAP